MKKIKLVLLIIAAVGVLFSCEKKEAEPVLDLGQTTAPIMLNPADGAAFVLKKDSADSTFATFEWTAADYTFDQIQDVTYVIQMDFADSNFRNVVDLAATTNIDYSFKVGKINSEVVKLGAPYDVESNIAFRVLSYINNQTDLTDSYSDVITLGISPYEDVEVEKFIYLLGSGTTIGWDNNAALQMTPVGEGQYAIVEHLTPGADQYIKFISVLGNWAPQWGTDDAGTSEEGTLVYRETEEEPDPAAIPVGDVEGNYYIFADTLNLVYETMLTSGELYLVGDGCTAGWENDNGIPFTQSPDTLTKFTLTTTLNAEGGLKLLEVSGQWAPQWGTNDEGTGEEGQLVYRPTESVEDPPNIPVPGTSGEYTITVNLTKMKYWITPN